MRVFLLNAACVFLLCPSARPQAAAVVPAHGQPVPLFNGKDLTAFDTVLRKQGLNHDPNGVFQIKDGALYISGSEFGYVITRREYETTICAPNSSGALRPTPASGPIPG